MKKTLPNFDSSRYPVGLLPQLNLRADAPGAELLQTLAERLPALITNL